MYDFMIGALPVLLAAALMLGLARHGNTLLEVLRSPRYRKAFVGALMAQGVRPAPRPRRVRRQAKTRRFFSLAILGDETGALTLAESAKLSTDMLRNGVAQTIIEKSPVLDRLPFIPMEGNAFKYNEEATLPGVEFRAVNAAYAESTGTFNQRTEALVILGGDADVDRYIVQTRGNLNDQRATQTSMKAKATRIKFQDSFINGDTTVDANSFDGLKKRLTGGQIIDMAVNGANVVGADSATRHTFFDKLDDLIGAVPGGPDILYMNAAILSKVRSAMRRETVNTTPIEQFGRQFDTYNGIALADIGKKADGTEILPQTETQGSSSVATSIYAVKYGRDEGDQAVSGLTNGGLTVLDKGLLETKNAYRVSIEFFCGLAVFGKGAARLRGVLNG